MKLKLTNSLGILPKKSLTLDPGLTVLIGCNGAGKTTLLQEIKERCSVKKTCRVALFSQQASGGTNELARRVFTDTLRAGEFLCMSEGERIYEVISNFAIEIGNIIRSLDDKVKDVVLLFDAIDSGLSLDQIASFKKFLLWFLKQDRKKDSRNYYVVTTSNTFAMCRSMHSLDVTTFKTHLITDYDVFADLIKETRKRKDKRKIKV